MPYFFPKLRKMSQNLLSAAVVIGALRVKDSLHTKSPLLAVNYFIFSRHFDNKL